MVKQATLKNIIFASMLAFAWSSDCLAAQPLQQNATPLLAKKILATAGGLIAARVTSMLIEAGAEYIDTTIAPYEKAVQVIPLLAWPKVEKTVSIITKVDLRAIVLDVVKHWMPNTFEIGVKLNTITAALAKADEAMEHFANYTIAVTPELEPLLADPQGMLAELFPLYSATQQKYVISWYQLSPTADSDPLIRHTFLLGLLYTLTGFCIGLLSNNAAKIMSQPATTYVHSGLGIIPFGQPATKAAIEATSIKLLSISLGIALTQTLFYLQDLLITNPKASAQEVYKSLRETGSKLFFGVDALMVIYSKA